MAQTAHTSILRYDLSPDPEAKHALDETFAAYAAMFTALDEMLTEKDGSNLVTLHELAYETIREKTRLPARLVTLGLRDFAANRNHPITPARLPLDEKLFSIKGPTTLSLATVRGRMVVPYDVAGYSNGTISIFAAQLVADGGAYQIDIGVTPHANRREINIMTSEGILSRVGRLIAGLANAAVDKAEGINKIAVVEQALRDIDSAADEARVDLGKSRAEEYRIQTRRSEIEADRRALDDKIRTAISTSRDDLAKAGVARQIDLEVQLAALDNALSAVRTQLDEGQQALHAILATRREAEEKLAALKHRLQHLPEAAAAAFGRTRSTDGASRAAAAVSRLTGVPSEGKGASVELEELDRLHREQAIEARLAQLKAGQN
ncbi:phage shock protein A [Rhizobium sp. BK529]|uniref:PspA/IM30 family protein n=1 Tax=unclassified Rhizobium TaxID=2613769 RepID=UPI001050C681|nr:MULTISPECIES: PspA/IM30 family protein [unclassified Rhizobium]MBB3594640.1 phage shock protein A [Rhizobium sp. BK529]TCS02381.1 phage shock protein A (PspA) family protein [Rhizobium sp. BK418]